MNELNELNTQTQRDRHRETDTHIRARACTCIHLSTQFPRRRLNDTGVTLRRSINSSKSKRELKRKTQTQT